MSSETEPSPESGEKLEKKFRFLSAQQVLDLTELQARQALPVAPQPQDPEKHSGALTYVFVSHRWSDPGNPDSDGKQLRALQQWLRYVKELLEATLLPSLGQMQTKEADDESKRGPLWSETLEGLVEGMPQAASLVSRILSHEDLEQKTLMMITSMKASDHNNIDVQKTIINPLDFIWVWYDCSCLPQKFPYGRTAEEREEFSWALQNLDRLAKQCELVYLHSEDYFDRAWCAFEHYQKSLDHLEGHISIDCDKVIQKEPVDWQMTENDNVEASETTEKPTSASELDSISIDQVGGKMAAQATKHLQMAKKTEQHEKLSKTVLGGLQKALRKQEFADAQENWKSLQEIISVSTNTPKGGVIDVVDLGKTRIRLERDPQEAQVPPLVKAMTQLVRELYAAVFTMSCRDAVVFANKVIKKNDPSSPSIVFPPESNACVPGVGVQCGLHDHRSAELLQDQSQVFQKCIETRQFLLGNKPCCPSLHRLEPVIATNQVPCTGDGCKAAKAMIQPGDVHVACGGPHCPSSQCYFCATGRSKENGKSVQSQACLDELVQFCNGRSSNSNDDENKVNADMPLCERKVTLDLFQLAHSILSRFGLRCTNSGDVAFVGLLALRNILLDDSVRRPEDIDEAERQRQNLQRISAGSLSFLRDAMEQVVVLYSNMLAIGKDVSSLVVSIVLKAPRWVHLDLAFSVVEANDTLAVKSSFKLGKEVQRYFMATPNNISIDLDVGEVAPLAQFFCSQKGCSGGWATCKHTMEKRLRQMTTSAYTPASLDAWATVDLPRPRACFSGLIANDQVYVIGGATGDKDMFGGYVHCAKTVFSAKLPLSTATTWTENAQLQTERRNHAGCVRTDPDTNKAVSLLVSGGRGSAYHWKSPDYLKTPSTFEGDIFSSFEVLDLTKDNPKWQNDTLELPYARSAHHMTCLDECLFVVAGRTDKALAKTGLTPESQKCNIYDFKGKRWVDGPSHPLAFAGGDSFLVRNRFWCILGGVTGGKLLSFFSILDLRPWVEWVASGCEEDSRPETTWSRGPDLPNNMASPCACLAPHKETGVDVDWILLVGPLKQHCYGLQLPADKYLDDALCEWHPKGIAVRDAPGSTRVRFFDLAWKPMGATPDCFALGCSLASHGTLAMVGGEIVSENEVCGSVYVRKLSSMYPKRNTVLPAYVAEKDDQVDEGSNDMKEGKFAARDRLRINDLYLIGRLGFPIQGERDLFVQDGFGAKKLRVLDPRKLHCQSCVAVTGTLEAARAHHDTALFGVETLVRVRRETQRRLSTICSRCLCNLYYKRNKKPAE